MNDEPQDTTDSEDRLVDRALSELLGGDAPPDLSERILSAANQQPLATPATGDSAMSETERTSTSKRKHWAMFAAAASLLLALGWVVAEGQFDGLRQAKVTLPSEETETSTDTPTQLAQSAPQDKINLGDELKDFDFGLPGLVDDGYGSPEADDKLKVRVIVTSDVIIEDLVSEGEAARESQVTGEPQEISEESFSEEQFRGAGQRFRIDASPGSEVNRYLAETSPTPGSVVADKERLTVSGDTLGLFGGGGIGGGGGEHPRADYSRSRARGRTLSSTARGQDARLTNRNDFYTLPERLGSTVPASTSAAHNVPTGDVRTIQQQITQKKAELLEIEVAKTVAAQQTNSPSALDALEAAIQKEMTRDPMLQSLQQEQHAATHQMTELKEIAKRKNSPEVERLQDHLRTLDQQIQKYRVSKETELRDRFKSAPNDLLALTMSEYTLRRRNAEDDLAKLEQQYKRKLARLQEIEDGRGPGNSGDQYTRIYENPFIEALGEKAVSTFSIDVDTASYANVRQFLMQSNQLPPPDAVRLEELVNYFDYDYSGPTGEVPFAAHVEVAGCPWQPEHRLVRIGIKGHEIERTKRPQSNLVFLIDVSGSMNQPAKLPLLVSGMKILTRELGENDRVAIVVYASSEGLALPSTRGDQQAKILAALDQLRAGGSTAGGAGIELAYKTAQDHFIEGGTNRVILCTDGDFNVGVTSNAELERMAEANAKESGIFLTVLGFGRGNLNDAMMEAISGKGNGNYHYVDNQTEARKVLVEKMVGTLITIAKDVKIQVEFNPAQVAGYRLLGYENRMLRTEDFNNDKKDAGEIGAGHTVTALYEIVPAGKSVGVPGVDPLKYQQVAKPASGAPTSGDLLTLKIRYKQPDGDTSTKLEFPITDGGSSFAAATDDFQFAAAVASFGMLLRNSEHRGNTSYAAVLEIAESSAKRDPHEYRAEFLQLVRRARQLAGE